MLMVKERIHLGASNIVYVGAWNSLIQQKRQEGKKETASEQAFATVGSDYFNFRGCLYCSAAAVY